MTASIRAATARRRCTRVGSGETRPSHRRRARAPVAGPGVVTSGAANRESRSESDRSRSGARVRRPSVPPLPGRRGDRSPTGRRRRARFVVAAATSAGVVMAIVFGQTTPDSVRFARRQSVLAAGDQHRAVPADLPGPRFALGTGAAAFLVRGEEHRRLGAATCRARPPVPVSGPLVVGQRCIYGQHGVGSFVVPERCRRVRRPIRGSFFGGVRVMPGVPVTSRFK
jgi:hypothetical protein